MRERSISRLSPSERACVWNACIAVTFFTLLPIAASHAHHGNPEVVLPVAKGVYRFPYQAGAEVRVTRDHVDHSTHNRLDMAATGDSSSNMIVAAADGIIAYLVDSNTMSCPRVTTRNPNPCNGYSGPSAACCNRGNTTCYNNTVGRNFCQNNFVMIRHPNGEWTKYTHLRTNSVSGRGWAVGDSIQAGQILGRQGDVGLATGSHLHFEVAVPDQVDDSIAPGQPGYDPLGIDITACGTCGFPSAIGQGGLMNQGNRTNRIPVFCQVGFVESGNTVTAEACDSQCTNANELASGQITDGSIDYTQVSNQVTTSGTYRIRSGGGAALRAGNRVVLRPGFRADSGSFFSASTGPCDSPGR